MQWRQVEVRDLGIRELDLAQSLRGALVLMRFPLYGGHLPLQHPEERRMTQLACAQKSPPLELAWRDLAPCAPEVTSVILLYKRPSVLVEPGALRHAEENLVRGRPRPDEAVVPDAARAESVKFVRAELLCAACVRRIGLILVPVPIPVPVSKGPRHRPVGELRAGGLLGRVHLRPLEAKWSVERGLEVHRARRRACSHEGALMSGSYGSYARTHPKARKLSVRKLTLLGRGARLERARELIVDDLVRVRRRLDHLTESESEGRLVSLRRAQHHVELLVLHRPRAVGVERVEEGIRISLLDGEPERAHRPIELRLV